MQALFNLPSGVRRVFAAAFFLALIPTFSLAQQLRIMEGSTTAIDPTAYRAYYGKLAGEPHVFTFTTTEETPVKVVLVVPDIPDAKTDVSATLVDTKNPDGLFVTADGALVEWQRFFDTAGRDSYLAGPTLEATLLPGEYRIQVSSAEDDASYVLIVSGENTFSLLETFRRYATVPAIKSDFFGKSAAEAYLTPLLLWPIFAILILAALAAFVAIVFLRRRARATLE
jgi:hypothetical protein